MNFWGSTQNVKHWNLRSKNFKIKSCVREHNIKTTKKQLYKLLQTMLTLLQNLCRNVWVLRSKKVGRHIEISWKLYVLLALESCAKGAQHHNKQKTTLHACKHLVMFAVNLYKKVWVLRSTKGDRHFEISLKLCSLLALESCAKGPQHHNKQKATLHACKHLVMFAVNLCRKVWVLRSMYKNG